MPNSNELLNFMHFINNYAPELITKYNSLLSASANNFKQINLSPDTLGIMSIPPSTNGNLIQRVSINPNEPDAQTCINNYATSHPNEFVSYFISMKCIEQMHELKNAGADEIQIIIGENPNGDHDGRNVVYNTLFFVGCQKRTANSDPKHIYFPDPNNSNVRNQVLEYIWPEVANPSSTSPHTSITLEQND